MGGFLAEPRSEKVSTAVRAFNFQSNHLWIGLRDNAKNRNFLWQTNNAVLSYTYWDVGQPNDYHGNQHCVGINYNYRWDDIKCDLKREYLCEAHIRE